MKITVKRLIVKIMFTGSKIFKTRNIEKTKKNEVKKTEYLLFLVNNFNIKKIVKLIINNKKNIIDQ